MANREGVPDTPGILLGHFLDTPEPGPEARGTLPGHFGPERPQETPVAGRGFRNSVGRQPPYTEAKEGWKLRSYGRQLPGLQPNQYCSGKWCLPSGCWSLSGPALRDTARLSQRYFMGGYSQSEVQVTNFFFLL